MMHGGAAPRSQDDVRKVAGNCARHDKQAGMGAEQVQRAGMYPRGSQIPPAQACRRWHLHAEYVQGVALKLPGKAQVEATREPMPSERDDQSSSVLLHLDAAQ